MIKFAKPVLSQKAEKNIAEVLSSGVFVHGSKTAEFEQLFKEQFRIPL